MLPTSLFLSDHTITHKICQRVAPFKKFLNFFPENVPAKEFLTETASGAREDLGCRFGKKSPSDKPKGFRMSINKGSKKNVDV